MAITVFTGPAACALLADAAFRESWHRLLEACPWATVFQSVDFVTTWYETYEQEYSPVIVVERSEGGELTGLLTLAKAARGQELIVAGGRQAEYQVWLNLPSEGSRFIRDALQTLKKLGHARALRFKYVPPSAPLEWIAPDDPLGKSVRSEAYRKPVMAVTEEKFCKTLKKKYQGRLNRLKQVGEVCFEKITDPAKLDRVIDRISAIYDLRIGVLNNSMPFREDARKRAFFLALMRKGTVLHATVLKVKDEVVAASLAFGQRGEVHMGIFAYSPLLAQLSPAKLLVVELRELLVREGFGALDFTPGGDWKKEFASRYEDVRLLTIFFSRLTRAREVLRVRLEVAAKKVLKRLNIQPAAVKGAVISLTSCVRLLNPKALLGKLKRRGNSPRLVRYVVDPAMVSHEQAPPQLSSNSLEELTSYAATLSASARQPFLSEAMTRLEKGCRLYSRTFGGRVVFLGWLATRLEQLACPASGQEHPLPEGAAALFGFRVEPSQSEYGLKLCLAEMVSDVREFPGVKQVHIVLDDGEATLKKASEELMARRVDD